MSLYEDEELGAPPAAVAVGWSKGVKLMQSHIQLKKAAAKTIPDIHPGSLMGPAKPRPVAQVLAPVIDLKTKQKVSDDSNVSGLGVSSLLSSKSSKSDRGSHRGAGFTVGDKSLIPLTDPNYQILNEYDPLWPNDYHKVVQDMRDKKNPGDEDDLETRKRQYTERGRERARERFTGTGRDRSDDRRSERQSDYAGLGTAPSSNNMNTGFGGITQPGGGTMQRRRDDDEEEDEESAESRRRNRRSAGSSGAAIAPPPSLTETSSPQIEPPPPRNGPAQGGASSHGLGIAAKIMAKYGYKHGQGLGRTEQGISQALAVEKTSKRGGRIIHEKDLMPPPMFGESFKTPSTPPNAMIGPATPPWAGGNNQDDDDPDMEQGGDGESGADNEAKPSITDLLKNPTKVVMCKNMVGPGEVDDDLEPEVKEECNTKYGEVNSVVIYEIPNVVPEESVRIFIEFKRVESAIKAVVDLNGRFFGGREVRARFYDVFKFKNLNLTD